MNKIEIVKKLFNAIETGQFDKAADLLTDDFTFNGAVPKPIGAKEWLSFHQKLLQGFPDFKFNLSKLSESGNTVNGSAMVEGTHTKNLPPVMPGYGSMLATNKTAKNPEENIVLSFKGDKVRKITVERVPHGGIAGFLEQIGVGVSAR